MTILPTDPPCRWDIFQQSALAYYSMPLRIMGIWDRKFSKFIRLLKGGKLRLEWLSPKSSIYHKIKQIKQQGTRLHWAIHEYRQETAVPSQPHACIPCSAYSLAHAINAIMAWYLTLHSSSTMPHAGYLYSLLRPGCLGGSWTNHKHLTIFLKGGAVANWRRIETPCRPQTNASVNCGQIFTSGSQATCGSFLPRSALP